MAAVYAFIIAVFVYGDIGMRDVPKVLLDAGKVTVMLMLIVANALLFAHVLTTERIPQQIAETIIGWGMGGWQFLIVINVLLLIAGMFMEPTGIILILAPILFPIATQLGIYPVRLGIIMVVNLEVGMVTPPIGLNLFVASGITGMSITQTARAALPWTLVLLLFLVIVTYVPAITLWLPGLLFCAVGAAGRAGCLPPHTTACHCLPPVAQATRHRLRLAYPACPGLVAPHRGTS